MCLVREARGGSTCRKGGGGLCLVWEGGASLPHHMDVLDSHERELRHLVLTLMLISFALDLVQLRVHAWPAWWVVSGEQ